MSSFYPYAGRYKSVPPFYSVIKVASAALVSLILLTACGGSGSSAITKDPQTDDQVTSKPLPEVVSACGLIAEVDVSPTRSADFYSLTTSADQGLELLTLSTLPDTVSGGDVVVGLRQLGDSNRLNSADCVAITAMADDQVVFQSPNLATSDQANTDDLQVFVQGLAEGPNRIFAHITRQSQVDVLALDVVNHPITGPIISGPHQTPYVCRTEEAGLGAPLDDDCSVESRFQWFYKSQVDQSFTELDDPFAPYPTDTMLTQVEDGSQVPFVVRVESSTINRGITRIAVLDDPAGRGPNADFQPNWVNRVLLSYGESCGVGYHQGLNGINSVLGSSVKFINDTIENQGPDTSAVLAPLLGIGDMLGRGYAVIHSTNTTLGVHCNDMLSGETTMMLKEHMIEQYGPVERLISAGGSGGAIQQLTTANNFPGLLDGLTPLIQFADVVSTAMSAIDCGLLANYFANADMDWSEQQRAAVSGHIGTNICGDWNDLFTDHVRSDTSCDGSVSRAEQGIYNRETNPDGVRCSLQDATKNLWGIYPAGHPEAGKARRPLDNQGLQYGLRALLEGDISAEQFVDLNQQIGGFDIDGFIVDDRMVMEEDVARVVYQTGRVTGRGTLAEVPIIDLNLYVDPVPVLGFHDQVRPFMTRERLRSSGTTATQSIWNGVPSHVEAYVRLNEWLDAAQLEEVAAEQRTERLADTVPILGGDLCTVNPAGPNLNPQQGVTLPLGLESGVIPSLQEFFPDRDLPVGFSLPIAQNHPLAQEYSEADIVMNPCATLFPPERSVRIQAGGPLAEDIVKCQLKPIDSADYQGLLSQDQVQALAETFTTGVCDWSKPSVGDTGASIIWATIGGEQLLTDEQGLLAPKALTWRVATQP